MTWTDLGYTLPDGIVHDLALDPADPSVLYAAMQDAGAPVWRLDRRFPAEPCVEDGFTLCLGEGGRFQVEVEWEDRFGGSGPGRLVGPPDGDTGFFWFFRENNFELAVKVLDGRSVNGNFWVFYASLTDVEFRLRVTDTETGRVRTYENPQGRFASRGDDEAFEPVP